MSQYILNQSNFSATGYTVQKYGYCEQWNFDIQRELPCGFFADVAYAGSHGVHLPQSNTNINQIPDSFISSGRSTVCCGTAGCDRADRYQLLATILLPAPLSAESASRQPRT